MNGEEKVRLVFCGSFLLFTLFSLRSLLSLH